MLHVEKIMIWFSDTSSDRSIQSWSSTTEAGDSCYIVMLIFQHDVSEDNNQVNTRERMCATGVGVFFWFFTNCISMGLGEMCS
jgi:hypothetical protein